MTDTPVNVEVGSVWVKEGRFAIVDDEWSHATGVRQYGLLVQGQTGRWLIVEAGWFRTAACIHRPGERVVVLGEGEIAFHEGDYTDTDEMTVGGNGVLAALNQMPGPIRLIAAVKEGE